MSQRRAAALAAAALLAACGQTRRAAPDAPPSASVPAPAPVPAPESGIGEEEALDPDETILAQAPLARLAKRVAPGARAGTFDAVLGPSSRRVVAEPARVSAPTAYRTPLAFYRLARALGTRVVPVTVLRAVPVGDLAAALASEPAGAAVLGELRVQNDGTVDVLLSTLSSASAGSPWEALSGSPVEVEGSREMSSLQRWASSPSPVPGEDAALLRDYVEMLVLDYLSANDARRTVVRAVHGLCLVENGSAFPRHPSSPVLDRLLRRLKEAARFPRGLRDALARLDRSRAAAVLNPGTFERWLVSPRVLVELDERRATLLTLVEARIADRGAGAVLTL